jgi:hypothetical protein
VGVSRARVNQILRLLKLPSDIRQSMIRMGDPLTSPIVTERNLRPLAKLPRAERKSLIRRFVRI